MQRFEGIWRKRHLLPIWILQIIGAIIYTVVAALLLAAAAYVRGHRRSSGYRYYGYSASELMEYAAVTGGVVLALSIGTLLLCIIEITLYARRRLNPIFLLSSACVKTLVWTAYFVLCIIAAAVGTVSVLDIIVSLVLAAVSIAQLVLGAVYTHRKRRGLLPTQHGHGHKTAGVETGYNAGYGGSAY
ncbi:hypothetical protein F5Y04DRAFT_258063 [Hypomontagnella monticulosa]|nr:hypothetical protein F5Y04DRAFT_258063 [Hypomontagnella monticulosa]